MFRPTTLADVEDNAAVIAALQRGDSAVFDRVYRHYFGRLCGFCSQYVHRQEEAEEVVQETMLWLWEYGATLLPELSLKTLLFTIVKNKALNRLSHAEVRRRVHQDIVERYASTFEDPDFYLADELLRLYREAVSNLPPEVRQAYEMNRNEQLTHKEIALRLGVSAQTVNYRIGQALRLLRTALKDYLPLFLLFFGEDFAG